MPNNIFTDEFLLALANWQRGWQENQEKRKFLASELKKYSERLPNKFKIVEEICYRKRFLHEEELKEILANEKDEGIVSWTTNLEIARDFKGMINSNGSNNRGAIFEHNPLASDLNRFPVIINISSLWKSDEFKKAVDSYEKRKPLESKPLIHFQDSQAEIVLESSLRYKEIIHLVGKSNDFDSLFEKTNQTEEDREAISKWLSSKKIFPGELSYLNRDSTKKLIAKMHNYVITKIMYHSYRSISTFSLSKNHRNRTFL